MTAVGACIGTYVRPVRIVAAASAGEPHSRANCHVTGQDLRHALLQDGRQPSLTTARTASPQVKTAWGEFQFALGEAGLLEMTRKPAGTFSKARMDMAGSLEALAKAISDEFVVDTRYH